jgi:hypothetical protein
MQFNCCFIFHVLVFILIKICSCDDNLLVKNANLHICSEKLDHCSKVTEFEIKNSQSNIKANNKAYVKIVFRVKGMKDDTIYTTHGYLAPYGALFINDTELNDNRRSKTYDVCLN